MLPNHPFLITRLFVNELETLFRNWRLNNVGISEYNSFQLQNEVNLTGMNSNVLFLDKETGNYLFLYLFHKTTFVNQNLLGRSTYR